MSLSIDNPSDDARDIREALTRWLDDFIDGRCERAEMKRAFLDVGRSHPEAPWDALALLDQYQRLGRLDAPLVRELKGAIAQLVFGPASQPVTGALAESDQTVDTVSDEDDAADAATDDVAMAAERAPPAVESLRPSPNQNPNPHPVRRARESVPSLAERALKSQPRSSEFDLPFSRNEPFCVPDEPVTVWPASSGLNDESLEPVHANAVVFGRAAASNDRHDRSLSGAAAPVRPAIPPSCMGADAPSLNVGDVLRGRYELLAVLGRGRTGIVYQALDRHRAHLTPEARQVAIKVLASDYQQSPELMARLEAQFHLAQSLSHPNVTRIFDLDRDGDTYFIVMELLQGELLSELRARLRGHPMQQRHALAIVSAVGAALAHAHRRGIVHGDVRPENIMITRLGEVRVLDFGFAGARALELHSAAAMPAAQRTQAAYASVERANGSEPHASDDVYSLACIAYELLSGRHPFGGRSAPLARAHGRTPRRIAGLNSRQMQVLQRALLWARGERSIDVVELLAGLGCGEAPAQLGTLEELSQPADGGGSRRWLIAALVLLLVALVAAAWWWFRGTMPGSLPAPATSAPPPQIFAPSLPPASDEVAEAANEESASAAAAGQPEVTQPPLPATESPPGTTAARSSARVPVIEFDKDTYVVSEGDGSVRLTIRRTGSISRELTFSWVLRPNSALAGSDYADIGPGVERIPAGVREVGLSIPLVQDTMKEGTEMFLAQLQVEDDVAELGERSSAAIIIVDDD